MPSVKEYIHREAHEEKGRSTKENIKLRVSSLHLRVLRGKTFLKHFLLQRPLDLGRLGLDTGGNHQLAGFDRLYAIPQIDAVLNA